MNPIAKIASVEGIVGDVSTDIIPSIAMQFLFKFKTLSFWFNQK